MKKIILALVFIGWFGASFGQECYKLGGTTYCNSETETGKPLVNE